MDFLPLELENIIYDYKKQLEFTEKFKLVLNEIKNIDYQIIFPDKNHYDRENHHLTSTITYNNIYFSKKSQYRLWRDNNIDDCLMIEDLFNDDIEVVIYDEDNSIVYF
jgi:hypothetical protein